MDSKKILSDIESIEIVSQKLEKLQEKKKSKKNEIDVASLLKGIGMKSEEIEQIIIIYQKLVEFSSL